MTFNSLSEKNIYYNFPVILFSLLLFFLISGPFLSDLSISLISLLFFLYSFKKKNFIYFKNKYFYFFLLFWIYLIFNTLIYNFNFDSLKISFFYFRYGIFVIAIAVFLHFDSKFIKYFFYCIFFCFTALILDGFYQYFVGENILGFQTGSAHRVSSFFHDELILGSYLTRLWPIFLDYLFLCLKKKIFVLFIYINFYLSEVLIFLSGDRSAFFYINLIAIFIILFSRKLLKLRLKTLILSILLIVVISLLNPNAKERVFDQTLNQMNLVKENENDRFYIFTQEHHEIYVTAYNIFLDNKILGVGVKNFRKVCSEKKYYIDDRQICDTHPHNTYLQILTETGIIGFNFLIFTLFYFCLYISRHFILKIKGQYYFTDFEICILSGIAIYLWPFVPTGNVFNNWLNIAMILNIPFLIWSRKLIKS